MFAMVRVTTNLAQSAIFSHHHGVATDFTKYGGTVHSLCGRRQIGCEFEANGE